MSLRHQQQSHSSMKYLLVTALTFCLAAVAPRHTVAADAPAWHLGSFSKHASLATCGSFAKDAINREHFKTYVQDVNTLVAGNNDVIVQISYSPQANGSTWMVVSAYSNNSALAEATRNRVREYIVKVVLFD